MHMGIASTGGRCAGGCDARAPSGSGTRVATATCGALEAPSRNTNIRSARTPSRLSSHAAYVQPASARRRKCAANARTQTPHACTSCGGRTLGVPDTRARRCVARVEAWCSGPPRRTPALPSGGESCADFARACRMQNRTTCTRARRPARATRASPWLDRARHQVRTRSSTAARVRVPPYRAHTTARSTQASSGANAPRGDPRPVSPPSAAGTRPPNAAAPQAARARNG